MSRFTKAERKKAKLRLALAGVSGCGKTYSALRIATGMGGNIAVIDTENDSSSLYASEFDFSSISLSDHSPEAYIKAIKDATQEGFDIVIVDSLSHVWTFCKAEIDKVAEKTFKGNSWAAWSKVTPRYDALIQCLIQSDVHIITTMRAKTETAQVEVNGRKKVVKLGMKTEMRDGIEYEFTTVIDIDHETNGAAVSKDRTHVFKGRDHLVLDEGIGEALMTWLMDGVEEVFVTPEQLNTLNNMFATITDERARAKIQREQPDLSRVLSKNYESVADRLTKVIDWQAMQAQPSQTVNNNQQAA
ncbi:ATP-binding protein [Psychrobacter aquimaris]|uniref:ATP-binding protein n=1 Tax=Psychrobacter aquimaris TaxID=292733 RepID=UPI0018DFA516|nr:ATP-binding protein [Psychrobacter aquimaris]